ncbi:hypothetical protein P6P90_03615 [Ectobacillus antri]|uniref:Integrase catalytic domain-containing protein n=1 Tax=Ectobacillus antri TaxID=2486280 RepID=A0ABT6H3A7_9BACI|nr:hypothetical protein [Ectobacillus antri]MDG4656412.1 hypothetical protein [Ectobacillus antri]MDG5753087.1 hypothetical protein [Ectobacillus antri]
MTKRRKIEDFKMLNEKELDLTLWPKVLTDNFDTQKKELYFRRKKAIEMYLSGKYLIKEIYNKTQINDLQIRHFLKRCLSHDKYGDLYGYRALIPYKRIKQNSPQPNKQRKGFANSFTLLLEQKPTLKELIHKWYIKPDRLDEIKISKRELHRKFIRACRDLGIALDQYPFNTTDVGYRTLARYLTKLESDYSNEAIKRYGKGHESTFLDTGGVSEKRMIIRPFERVQLDGHKIDLIMVIKFKTPEGDEFTETIHRLFLITIIDVATRVVLGYQLSLGREYNQFDVLKCVKNALEPKKKINLTIPELNYPDNGGYHSLAIPETEWAVWDEILFDNAKANLAKMVRLKLNETLGCDVNYGPVAKPTRRPIIERFFHTLEQNGYHRLINTTGSNTSDPRRGRPVQEAIKYEITVDKIQELTEIMIAKYNNDSHEGVNGFTPLEVMEQRIKKGTPVRKVSEEKREELNLFTIKAVRTIKGGVKEGRKPYVTVENVSYTSDVLSRSPGLAGEKLELIINTEDLRVIRAFLEDGSEFGMLTAHGKWGIVQHSMEERKAINKLIRERKITISDSRDPVEALKNYLSTKSITDKKSRNQLQKVTSVKRANKHDEIEIVEVLSEDELHSNVSNAKTIRKYEEDHIFQKSLPKLPNSIIF